MTNRNPVNHRCSICDNVSNPDIANSSENYKSGLYFVADPDNPLFEICSECYEAVCETEFEYELEDIEDYDLYEDAEEDVTK